MPLYLRRDYVVVTINEQLKRADSEVLQWVINRI